MIQKTDKNDFFWEFLSAKKKSKFRLKFSKLMIISPD